MDDETTQIEPKTTQNQILTPEIEKLTSRIASKIIGYFDVIILILNKMLVSSNEEDKGNITKFITSIKELKANLTKIFQKEQINLVEINEATTSEIVEMLSLLLALLSAAPAILGGKKYKLYRQRGGETTEEILTNLDSEKWNGVEGLQILTEMMNEKIDSATNGWKSYFQFDSTKKSNIIKYNDALDKIVDKLIKRILIFIEPYILRDDDTSELADSSRKKMLQNALLVFKMNKTRLQTEIDKIDKNTDDSKIMGLKNKIKQMEQLETILKILPMLSGFEKEQEANVKNNIKRLYNTISNQMTNPDSGNPNSGNPDSGNPNSGNPDSGNPETLDIEKKTLNKLLSQVVAELNSNLMLFTKFLTNKNKNTLDEASKKQTEQIILDISSMPEKNITSLKSIGIIIEEGTPSFMELDTKLSMLAGRKTKGRKRGSKKKRKSKKGKSKKRKSRKKRLLRRK
jgi:hypothetical protein